MANHFLSGRTQGIGGLGAQSMFGAIRNNQALEQRQRDQVTRQLQEQILQRQLTAPVSLGKGGVARYQPGSGWNVTPPQEQPAGMFEGTGMQAQLMNSLSSADPNVRALAFSELTKQRTIATPQGTYTVPGSDPAILNGIIQGAGFDPIGMAAGQDGQDGPATFTRKPPTESQSNSLGFFNQMGLAHRQMEEILASPDFDSASVVLQALQRDGLTPNFANQFATPEEQAFASAAERFIRGKLRKESGAVIGAEEAMKEYRAFFPQVGDGDLVRSQKGDARRQALVSMAQQAGPAYAALPDMDQLYRHQNGTLLGLSDIIATAEARGITPTEALQQALDQGTIRRLVEE